VRVQTVHVEADRELARPLYVEAEVAAELLAHEAADDQIEIFLNRLIFDICWLIKNGLQFFTRRRDAFELDLEEQMALHLLTVRLTDDFDLLVALS